MNQNKNKEQYERYKRVLGDEFIPDTFEKFQDIKYGDKNKWNDLKAKYKTVNKYKVDYGEVKASEILRLDKISLDNKKLMHNRSTRLHGNIGVLSFDNQCKIAHSKINYQFNDSFVNFKGTKDNIILMTETPVYKTLKKGELVDGKVSKSDRMYDSEAKFFEYMRELHPNKNDTFEFTILLERNICESCRKVKEQFENDYKNATINIVSGKKFIRYKQKTDSTIKEVEVSPWEWRKGLKEQK